MVENRIVRITDNRIHNDVTEISELAGCSYQHAFEVYMEILTQRQTLSPDEVIEVAITIRGDQ